jgi:hypothetical protein
MNDTVGFYVIQSILGGRIVSEQTRDLRKDAISLARSLAHEKNTEITSVRVITIDGEHVKTYKVQ